jgi:hypothetical protein
MYNGTRSKSSGAAVHDAGDVRLDSSLVECKYTGSPGEPLKRMPKLVKEFEKIANEAWAEGYDPVMALRFYAPKSSLSRNDGWIDFIVRLVEDDICRS